MSSSNCTNCGKLEMFMIDDINKNKTEPTTTNIFKTILKKIKEKSFTNKNVINDPDLGNVYEDVNNKYEWDIIEKQENFEDKLLYFKTFCTNIVTNYFFSNPQKYYNFLNYVNNEFTSMVDNYKNQNRLEKDDILFLFKGGNIIKLFEKSAFNQFPFSARQILSNYYDEYFQRSDSDFTIYINPSLGNFNKKVIEITNLTADKLISIRSYLEKYISYYFFVEGKTITDKMKKLCDEKCKKEFITKLNEYIVNVKHNTLEEFSNLCCKLGSYTFEMKNDKLKSDPIFKTEKKDDIIIIENNDKSFKLRTEKNNNDIFLSKNTALKFNGSNFNLCRLKIPFTINYKERKAAFDPTIQNNSIISSGELIDVSIPKDESVTHFYSNLKGNLAEYSINNDGQTFSFYAYSTSYLLHDLESIILATKYPWTITKYNKRINRIFLLYLLDLMSVKDSNIYSHSLETKLAYLEYFYQVANECKTAIELKDYGKPGSQLRIKKIIYKDKADNKLIYYGIFAMKKYMKNLFRARFRENFTGNKLKEYENFFDIIIENIKICTSFIKQVIEWINEKVNININNLYNNNMINLY